jgi:hypothetical protein
MYSSVKGLRKNVKSPNMNGAEARRRSAEGFSGQSPYLEINFSRGLRRLVLP